MGQNTKIYKKFQGYSLKDCSCRYCLFNRGGKRGCSLDECCCMEEKIEALMLERGLERENAEGMLAESRGNKTESFNALAVSA